MKSTQPRKEHKTYISGKVKGVPIEIIQKKFENAEKYLLSIGMSPVNPIKKGFDLKKSDHEQLITDLPLLLGSKSIFILDCWLESKQSKIELKIAHEYGISVIYESSILKNVVKIEKVKDAILEVTGLSFKDYAVESRKRELFYSRMIFIQYCHEYQEMSLTDIGDILQRDHATILHSLKTFKNEVKFNADFREKANKVNQILNKP